MNKRLALGAVAAVAAIVIVMSLYPAPPEDITPQNLKSKLLLLIPDSAIAFAKIDVNRAINLIGQENLGNISRGVDTSRIDTLILILFGLEGETARAVSLVSGDLDVGSVLPENDSQAEPLSYKGIGLHRETAQSTYVLGSLSDGVLIMGDLDYVKLVIDRVSDGAGDSFLEIPEISKINSKLAGHHTYLISLFKPELMGAVPELDEVPPMALSAFGSVQAIGAGIDEDSRVELLLSCSDASAAEGLKSFMTFAASQMGRMISLTPNAEIETDFPGLEKWVVEDFLRDLHISSEGNLITVSTGPISDMTRILSESVSDV